MMVRVFPILIATTLVSPLILTPTFSEAADFTHLLSAGDESGNKGFGIFKSWDFHIEPSFRFDIATANINREAPCVPTQAHAGDLANTNPRLVIDNDRCDEPRIVFNREADFKHTRSTLDIDLRAGLYKNLELRINIPYVFSSTRSLSYADGVNAQNSSIDPIDSSRNPEAAADRVRRNGENVFSPNQSSAGFVTSLDQMQIFRFFELENSPKTFERKGLADPSVGIHWAPWSDARDDTKATMLIGMDYVMPIAEVQKHDNTAVGLGVHELQWKVAASKNFGRFEPYFGAEYFLPLPATDSLYGSVDRIQGQGQGQVLRNPPQRGLFTIGTEITAYEDQEKGIHHAFDLRFQFGYTSEGRDYTPLFDHMTDPGNPCNGVTIDQVRPEFDQQGRLLNGNDVACAWVIRQPSNAGGRNTAIYDLADAIERGSTETFAFTDLMSVDSHAVFGGQLGIHLQPSPYFQLRGVAGLTHRQAHLLTNARTGRTNPATGGDSVSMIDPTERNPAYNPSYDNSGNRFRVERYNTWHFMITTALQF